MCDASDCSAQARLTITYRSEPPAPKLGKQVGKVDVCMEHTGFAVPLPAEGQVWHLIVERCAPLPTSPESQP